MARVLVGEPDRQIRKFISGILADLDRPPRCNDKPFRFADLHVLAAAIGTLEPAYALSA